MNKLGGLRFFLMNTLVFILFQNLIVINAFSVHSTGDLYNSNDHIQLLNHTNLNANLYGQDKAVLIEFYAHWCGACQNYAKHWKEIAKETLGWHANVVRVAAINCGDPANDEICREHSIQYYPTLKIFPPKAQHSKQAILIQKGSMESIVNEVLKFVENVIEKPPNWPVLEPFLSKRLDALFATNRQAKYALLIFEKNDSIIGKNIILDFSLYSKELIIRRTTPTANKALMSIMEIDDRHLPLVFIVYNKEQQNGKKYERFDRNFVKSQNIIDNNNNEELDRTSLKLLIEAFLKQSNLVQVENQNQVKHDDNPKQFELNKEKFIADLTKMKSIVYMQDLESSLHYMLRSEIPRLTPISGEKLSILNEWLRILVKFFPGRKPVVNYLNQLYENINSSLDKEINRTYWRSLTDTQTLDAFLPKKTEWRHCLGSESKYRGYPCSLWTLFHVLSVNQIEIEQSNVTPFGTNFKVKEIIDALIPFIREFFGCKECAQNFMKETRDYQEKIIKNTDAIMYLWSVHNNVNHRLAKENGEHDPLFPKVQFPTQEQCPKCYLNKTNSLDVEQNSSSLSTDPDEILKFLISFYSKEKIEGKIELDEEAKSEIDRKMNEDKTVKGLEKREDYLSRKKLGIDNLDLIHDDDLKNYSNQKSSDIKLSAMLVFFIVFVFGSMYVYFNFIKKKSKQKAHII